MSTPLLGQLMQVGFAFAPRGWAQANGQILNISQQSALFALFGTTYGGNGQTTFQLPDMRGRVAIHQGQGLGLSAYTLGEVTGVENVTLTQGQMPLHTHTLQASTNKATTQVPANSSLLAHADDTSGKGSTPAIYIPSNTSTASVNLAGVGTAGSSQPFSILQPLLVINVIVAMTGVFPSRN